jgi:hypothetical protein
MKITPLIALLPFLALAACSSDDAPPVAETSNTDSAPSVVAHPKVSDDNVFKSQLDALDAAKQPGKTAQESIDKNQKALEEANQ